jgi:hypothetical protein
MGFDTWKEFNLVSIYHLSSKNWARIDLLPFEFVATILNSHTFQY